MRRNNLPGVTSLITCSLSAKVGFLRAISFVSVDSSWLARGSTWSLNQAMATVKPAAASTTGTMSRRIDMPLALNATISFSDAMRLNACSVDTNTAIGSVIATVNGTDSSRNSAMTCQGSPLPTSSPRRLAT